MRAHCFPRLGTHRVKLFARLQDLVDFRFADAFDGQQVLARRAQYAAERRQALRAQARTRTRKVFFL